VRAAGEQKQPHAGVARRLRQQPRAFQIDAEHLLVVAHGSVLLDERTFRPRLRQMDHHFGAGHGLAHRRRVEQIADHRLVPIEPRPVQQIERPQLAALLRPVLDQRAPQLGAGAGDRDHVDFSFPSRTRTSCRYCMPRAVQSSS
jgi:hypothetical protein